MSDPTVVLVHGAFADASGYAGIIRELHSAGVTAIAPPNPLRSLASDAAAAAAVVGAIDGPVVLVGHSYGGAVITQASAGLGNVTALVYLAAFGLDAGESCASVQQPFPPSMLASTSVPTPYPAPGAPQGPDLYISKEGFRETFCADVPVDVAEVMFATQRPLSLAALTENATVAGWKNKPSWFLVSETTTTTAGRGTVHGPADGRDHRLDRRIAHGVHRQPGAGGRLHRRRSPANRAPGPGWRRHGIRTSAGRRGPPPRLRQRTAVPGRP